MALDRTCPLLLSRTRQTKEKMTFAAAASSEQRGRWKSSPEMYDSGATRIAHVSVRKETARMLLATRSGRRPGAPRIRERTGGIRHRADRRTPGVAACALGCVRALKTVQ